MQRAIKNKCDAIEVDCLGAYNHEVVTKRWKDPLTKEDAYDFAKWLSAMAHDLGIAIGLKNVAGLAPRLVNDFDFAVVESCSHSEKVCALYEQFPKQGKAVFVIHYDKYGGSFEKQKAAMVRELKGFGYTCIFNEKSLQNPSIQFDCDTGSKTSISGKSTTVSNTNTKTSNNKSSNVKAPANENNNKQTVGTNNASQNNVASKPNVDISSNENNDVNESDEIFVEDNGEVSQNEDIDQNESASTKNTNKKTRKCIVRN